MKTRLIDNPAVILCHWLPLSLSLPSCVVIPDYGCDFPSLVECCRWNASLACVCVSACSLEWTDNVCCGQLVPRKFIVLGVFAVCWYVVKSQP